jgi:hypothetical protein
MTEALARAFKHTLNRALRQLPDRSDAACRACAARYVAALVSRGALWDGELADQMQSSFGAFVLPEVDRSTLAASMRADCDMGTLLARTLALTGVRLLPAAQAAVDAAASAGAARTPVRFERVGPSHRSDSDERAPVCRRCGNP